MTDKIFKLFLIYHLVLFHGWDAFSMSCSEVREHQAQSQIASQWVED